MDNVRYRNTKELYPGDSHGEGYQLVKKKPEQERKKTFYVDLDLESYKNANDQIREGEAEDEPIHWYYGDLQGKLDKSKKQNQSLHQLNMNEGGQGNSELGVESRKLTLHDLNLMRYKKDIAEQEKDKEASLATPAVRWRSRNAVAGKVDGYITFAKFIVVAIVVCMYMAQSYGFLHKWESSCRNDLANHYWRCMEKTKECHKMFIDRKMYYCTKKDWEENKDNFCTTGYCRDDSACQDDEFKPRVHAFATVFKNCMFNSTERGNDCPNAMKAGSNPYDDCVFGVKIFLFVFLIKDLFIDTFMNGILEPAFVEKAPFCFTYTKMMVIIGVITFWGFYIISRDPAPEDLLDLCYVVLFVGSTLFLDIIKLFRRNYLNAEEVSAMKHKETSQEECNVKWARQSVKWTMITKAFFIPIWTAIILVVLSWKETDIKNIIYFALQPFDDLFADIATTDFVFLINGIMINTHYKTFKYRSLVNMIFKLTFMMTISSMLIQLMLIYKFVSDMIYGKQYYSDKSHLFPSLVGDIVITFFFVFDFINNIFKLRASWFLCEYSYLIACDIKCDLDNIEQIEDVVAFKNLLGKSHKDNQVVNPSMCNFNIEFRKIAKVDGDDHDLDKTVKNDSDSEE